ncbi:PqqD family protein [Streptomyces sp. NPDC052101]|uniref:PqqD family protein n=1 Tax=Streptomyces sp. NPDC052101 TaxID=3155763 RepID=UPI00343129F3
MYKIFGHLELHSASTGAWFRCSPVGAAMWITLRQHDGDVHRAAHVLASRWSTDPVNMCADLEVWVGELCDLGLLATEPHDTGEYREHRG